MRCLHWIRRRLLQFADSSTTLVKVDVVIKQVLRDGSKQRIILLHMPACVGIAGDAP